MESPFHNILNNMKSVLIINHDYFLLKQTEKSPRPLLPQQMKTRTAAAGSQDAGATCLDQLCRHVARDNPRHSTPPHGPLFTSQNLTSSESSTNENQQLVW